MPSVAQSKAELQTQRTKLASSYNALLDEFASKDLHTVGNYTLGQLVGKGSFGKVYLAYHKLTNGSKVVLKSTKKDDPNLAREIHHHRQFIHPHIARLYEVIVTENSVWLVLEYCPGDELYNYLTHHGALDPPVVQKIFTQLVGAVSYVHGKSCVHRDLKLENILLDKNQDVKLCDFGFTREYEGKSSYLQTWCGTVCYSAPEMLKGEKYAGERVDVWSLGIILYALLCGELPFDEDDENVTKMKILKEEPNYPDSIPQSAKDLVTSMLSKRPLLRPTLADILANPWLSEHAPQQQAILKLQQPAPFTTDLEKDVLHRMKSAGVNIDTVIENVLSQRCDAMAGWWALLLEKEERKMRRRERRRKEKEAETRSLKRMSVASSRLDRIAPTILESHEEAMSKENLVTGEQASSAEPVASPVDRGREKTRSEHHAKSTDGSQIENTPSLRTPAHRTSYRASSGSRRRIAQLGPPRDSRKRLSSLQIVTNSADMTSPVNAIKSNEDGKKRKKLQPPFINQLASLKQWFQQSAKRSKSPPKGPNGEFLSPTSAFRQPGDPILKRISSESALKRPSNGNTRPDVGAPRATYPARPRIATNSSIGSNRRMSQSPSPLTPSSSYRRSTASGLRGRKSTSSSLSSIRSTYPTHPTHSKASSTSSASAVSPSVVSSKSFSNRPVRSPHSSLKVLPAGASTPTALVFPSNVRVARAKAPPSLALGDNSAHFNHHLGNSSAFSSFGPPSPGLIFAKRKRTPFKGPMLGPGTSRRKTDSASVSRANSVSRKSGEIIEEEEEEEEEENDDEFEEVDAFTPDDGAEMLENPFDTIGHIRNKTEEDNYEARLQPKLGPAAEIDSPTEVSPTTAK